MKKILTIIAGLLVISTLRAQDKDTIEVQKIGDKYFIVVDHKDPDTTRYMPLNYHKGFDSHFMVVGLTTIGFNQTWNTTSSIVNGVLSQKSKTNSIGDVANYEFSPMLLWRHGDKLLLEFEPSFDGSSLGVNWADVSYFAAPGLIIRAGYLVLPFGTYNKRLAAGWINKLAYDPTSITSSPVESDWGIEASGGFQVGREKINYDVALSNGFGVNGDGSVYNPGIVDNNIAKTVSGRFGWLPMSNSSLEIGVSGIYGRAGQDTGVNRNLSTIMGAADIQYIFSKAPVTINVKAQYNVMYVTRANYANPNDSSAQAYFTFNNFTQGYYAMLSLRPVVQNKVLRNFEIAGRISQFETPSGSAWETHIRQIDASIDYWLNWRTVVKLSYENLLQTNPSNAEIALADSRSLSHIIVVQFSVQF